MRVPFARPVLSLLAFSSFALAAPAFADEPAAAPAPTGLRADLLGQLGYRTHQVIELEQAIPAKKFGWRPAKGVRSVEEVFQHIAGSNYFLMDKAGCPIPDDIKPSMKGEDLGVAGMGKDPAAIKASIEKSVDHVKKCLAGFSDADLEKQVDFFGNKLTVRGMFLVVLSHVSEHLGQSIAYARMNGVVPPWSAKQEMHEKKDAKK